MSRNVVVGLAELQDLLGRMSLNAAQLRLLKKYIGRAAVRANKRYIKAGKNLDGSAWVPLKPSRRKKANRLYGMRNKLFYRDRRGGVELSFNNRHVRQNAAANQFGQTTRHTANQLRKRLDNEAPCNRGLARKLRAAGYTVRKKGTRGQSRTVKPSVKWMTQNLTNKEAGAILHRLNNTTPKTSWSIVLPKRQLLGAHEDVVMKTIDNYLSKL